jgi:hypothetical protein
VTQQQQAPSASTTTAATKRTPQPYQMGFAEASPFAALRLRWCDLLRMSPVTTSVATTRPAASSVSSHQAVAVAWFTNVAFNVPHAGKIGFTILLNLVDATWSRVRQR